MDFGYFKNSDVNLVLAKYVSDIGAALLLGTHLWVLGQDKREAHLLSGF